MAVTEAERVKSEKPLTPRRVHGLPLVGNVLDMAKDPGRFFYNCFRQYGPVFRINLLGTERTVIAGPEAANFMGTREGRESLRSREFWEGLRDEFGLKYMLNAEDGEIHDKLRNVMKRGYSKEALKGHWNELAAVTDNVLSRDWKPGTSAAVVQAMQYMVTEQLGMLLTGEAPREYVKDIRTTILYILNVLVTRQRPKFMMHDPRYKRAKERVFELGRRMVAEYHRNSGTKLDSEKTIIDDLMDAHERDPDLIPGSDLMITVLGPYIAGLDTVANTTSSCLYAVLKHKDVLARIHKEVDEVYASGPIDEKDFMDRLPATNGAIMEAMRLYPIAVAGMRVATRDFVFCGHQIKKDEMLFVATAVPHLMEEYYPDPEKFDIDRYEKPRNEHMKPGIYSPFGRGPHVCLGKSTAEILMAVTMSRLFHQLDLELDPPGYVLETKAAPTPGPSMKFKVKVKGLRHP